jgi:hypothetical protein
MADAIADTGFPSPIRNHYDAARYQCECTFNPMQELAGEPEQAVAPRVGPETDRSPSVRTGHNEETTQMRNKLMIGVAAIALVAGTGLANAQGNKEHAAPPAAGAAKMDQGAKMNQGAKMDQGARSDQDADKTAQDMKANPESQPSGRAAEEEGHGKGKTHKAQAPSKSKNAEAPSKTNNAQNAVPSKGGKESTTAEQKGGENGGKAAATAKTGGGGASVKLSADQRTKIHKLVINEHNAPRVAHVDFDIRVGTVIPRGKVHYVPVPSTIVEIEPEWRGFMYFLVGDQIVIVEPDTLRIVAVIAA